MDTLDTLIQAMQHAAGAYADADAVVVERDLEDRRPLVKREAILRIMQTPNELTGKPHSASSAEAFVELDRGYLQHRLAQSVACVDVIMARAAYEASRARMWAAVRPMEEAL